MCNIIKQWQEDVGNWMQRHNSFRGKIMSHVMLLKPPAHTDYHQPNNHKSLPKASSSVIPKAKGASIVSSELKTAASSFTWKPKSLHARESAMEVGQVAGWVTVQTDPLFPLKQGSSEVIQCVRVCGAGELQPLLIRRHMSGWVGTCGTILHL